MFPIAEACGYMHNVLAIAAVHKTPQYVYFGTLLYKIKREDTCCMPNTCRHKTHMAFWEKRSQILELQMKTMRWVILLPLLLLLLLLLLLIIIIIIIIIIALKGEIEDFYNLLTVPWTVSNTYSQVARAQSCANHVQHIEHSSHVTCHVPHGTKGQLS